MLYLVICESSQTLLEKLAINYMLMVVSAHAQTSTLGLSIAMTYLTENSVGSGLVCIENYNTIVSFSLTQQNSGYSYNYVTVLRYEWHTMLLGLAQWLCSHNND